MVRVRFAPSPTGPLHIGSIRTALYNYLFAKKNNGSFILRIEDTDKKRYVFKSEKHIIESLNWCKIFPDEGICCGGKYGPYRQSERIHIYNYYIKYLINNGYAYYSFDKKMNKNNYVIRLKVPKNKKKYIEIQDLIKGKIYIPTNNIDDKILIKSDGNPTYHFANVIDDHLMKITHVIRGEEWISSTPFHLILYKYFNWIPPYFAHLPLLLSSKGKISKRNLNSKKIIYPIKWTENKKIYNGFKEKGFLPESFINFIVLLGWKPKIEKELFSLKELKFIFSIKDINKTNAKVNIQKAVWFNQQYIKKKSLKEIIFLFLYELNKKQITLEKIKKILKKEIIKEILKRISFFSDIFNEIFFIPPKFYDVNIIKKNFNKYDIFILEKIIDIFSLNLNKKINNDYLIKSFISNLNKEKIIKVKKIIRFSIVGKLYGMDIFIILRIIETNDLLKRLKKLLIKFNSILN
ncbi:glutamate--tRNA ligase [Candidatus Shikimatogenerans silvanidophilus]|uniref:glutamate--tRNA ligase n=1 Tax=Candidatus Shikimatogenerans silvanidophilus TaxID=2782547 RepID=UPI001BA48021|nr:glutamate--tRNA ligase family protein [Candidatus Shikimatogenerans silvanidophilus]